MSDTIVILAGIGLYNIIRFSSLLNKPRKFICELNFFNELIHCPMCLGFWTGVITSLFISHSMNIQCVVYGLACSACCVIYEYIVSCLDELLDKYKHDR